MSKNYKKTSTVKFSHIGQTRQSLFEPFLPVTSVFFNTEFGLIVYYDDQKKWTKPAQLRFHNDIMESAAGVNSGYYQGLTVEKKQKNDDLYLEANPKYELLTFEQAALLKNK